MCVEVYGPPQDEAAERRLSDEEGTSLLMMDSANTGPIIPVRQVRDYAVEWSQQETLPGAVGDVCETPTSSAPSSPSADMYVRIRAKRTDTLLFRWIKDLGERVELRPGWQMPGSPGQLALQVLGV